MAFENNGERDVASNVSTIPSTTNIKTSSTLRKGGLFYLVFVMFALDPFFRHDLLDAIDGGQGCCIHSFSELAARRRKYMYPRTPNTPPFATSVTCWGY